MAVFVVVIAILAVPGASAAPRPIGVPESLATTPGFPEGIAVGPDGNLYVSQVAFAPTSNILILNRFSGAVVGTIPVSAGPGGRVNIAGLMFDFAGNLYAADVADSLAGGANGRVLKIAPGGAVTTLASGMLLPNGFAHDAMDNVYVSESLTGRIWKITPAGSVTLFIEHDLLKAHAPPPGFPPVGVNGLAFTRADRALIAANTVDGTLVRIPLRPDGSAGAPAVAATGLFGADGIAIDVSQNVYVALNPLDRIAVVSSSGSVIAIYGATGSPLINPASLAFNGRTLYITDFAIFTPGGVPGVSVMTTTLPGAPLV